MKRIKLENDCYKEISYWHSNKTQIKYIDYFNSKDELHRLNGPASIWYNMDSIVISIYYFINDVEYSKEEFNKKLNIERNLKLLNKVYL